MTSASDLRDSFRGYFVKQGHELVQSAPIVPANDPTLMFSNAGMVPFKDVFTGQERRPYTRATSSQKCVRVSGKHNDLENVGVTARHHTFFEMLGNFSFGDYFKEEAIVYAWEYLTKVLGLPRERLIVTVFGGEGELPADTQAEALWKKIAGLPDARLLRLGAADNFWQMGETGPCGPCSEIHYFFGEGEPALDRFGAEPDERGSGWVEIWNNVFMQFERQTGGKLLPLPKPSIDTGMGLERLACVVQGVVSNYDTDLLRPIVELASQIAKKPYGASLAADDVSMRVIADHARAAAFLVAEGVFPDRDGREYVLRRIMRRAIRHGHRLGIERPFLHTCALRVVELMGKEYPELSERRELIAQIVQQEEERFRATLKRGLDRLADVSFAGQPAASRVLPGAVAFELYDTYGFPLDLQEVIGREQGFGIDNAGFEQEMAHARERSAGSKVGDAAVQQRYRNLRQRFSIPVTFTGYDQEKTSSELLAVRNDRGEEGQLKAGEHGELVTGKTPFYAESGGQVGDRGEIRAFSANGERVGLFIVEDTVRPVEGLIVHRGFLKEGVLIHQPIPHPDTTRDPRRVTSVELEVSQRLRAATRRNHSATHLLHWALRTVIGSHAMQKGSLVGPDRLRFDYSAAQPLTIEQIDCIEDMVNDCVLQDVEITTKSLPMAEAKQHGAIGIFEEKYGDVVRMLKIGDSIELCGGTHAERTGNIGFFKILSDAGIAAGVRRIEAVTGHNTVAHMRKLEKQLGEVAGLIKASPHELVDKVQRLLDKQKEQTRELEQLKKKMISGGSRDLSADAREIAGVRVLSATVEVGDPKAMRELADQLRDKLAPAVIALGSATPDGRALLVCTVSKELTGRFRAGDIIKELAGMVGGGGGGRPDFAQAGGSDPAQLGAAMARVYALVGGS